jgi:hypothetical protein
MKNPNQSERIIADWKLNRDEQTKWLKKLSALSLVPGIKSICFDDKELHIEYDPAIQNQDSINSKLRATGFPAIHLHTEPIPGP